MLAQPPQSTLPLRSRLVRVTLGSLRLDAHSVVCRRLPLLQCRVFVPPYAVLTYVGNLLLLEALAIMPLS